MDKHPEIPPEQVEAIERFLLQELSPEEAQAFAARLAEDAHLKKATDEMRLLFTGIQEATLTKQLDDFHNPVPVAQNNAKPATGKLFPLKQWLVAASVIGAICLAAWLLLRPAKTERLFAAYFRPDPGLISAMSTTDRYLFDRAMVDYKTGAYTAAIDTWNRLQATQPINDTLQYFLGSAYLATGQSDKALLFFQKVPAASVFAKEALWYAGLAQLKKGAKEEAIHLIDQSNHPQKAALLAKLRE